MDGMSVREAKREFGLSRKTVRKMLEDPAAALAPEQLIEARGEKRLRRCQKHLLRQDLLIIDELGFVPQSKTGAEVLFEGFS